MKNYSWVTTLPHFLLTIIAFLLGAALAGCSGTNTPIPPQPEQSTSTPQPTSSTPGILSFTFDSPSASVPADWEILYASFDPDSQRPAVLQAQVQENRFVIENQGTFSGLYALYTGSSSTSNFQITLETAPDGVSPMGVFLVCRYSEAGWYQFRISTGSSSIQYVQPQSGIYNATVLVEGPGVFLDDGKHLLRAVCDQNQLTLQVDAKQILRKEADFLPVGSFGFGVEAYKTPGGRKIFDNLEILALGGDSLSASVPAFTQAAELKPATQTPAASPTAEATQTSTPTPTPTATATQTPRPTSIPEGELVLYQTEFESQDQTIADWRSFAFSFAEKGFVTTGFETYTINGVYRFRTSDPDMGKTLRIFSIYDREFASPDVDISTRGLAPYTQGSLGLICRYSEAGWYQFMVAPGGIWNIRLAKPDQNGQFHFYTISSGSRWLGQKVDLRAECKSDRLIFYIDGEKIASLHDSTFTSGKVGLLSWSFPLSGEAGMGMQAGDTGMADNFSVQRAQWNETGLIGPAPTPGAEGLIYTTDFSRLDDLNPYFSKVDSGVQDVPGSPLLVGGPGHPAPHTYQYINDFDPGPDIEIKADVLGAVNWPRGLICRYTEDGWYETFYMKDSAEYTRVALVRKERDEQGKFTQTLLGTYYPPVAASRVNLSLTCVGNQISVRLNGERVLYAEDNIWAGGRYGFFITDNPPGSLRSTLLSYTVRPAVALQVGDTFSDEIFDTPETIASGFNMSLDDPRVRIQDSALLLVPGQSALHVFTTKKYENGEFSLDVEFMAETSINLHCRAESSSDIGAEIRSNGDWNLVWRMEQVLATGNNPVIQAGKNQLILSCKDDQALLIANGETLAAVTIPDYTPASGKTGFDVFEGSSEVKINRLGVKILQSASLTAAPTLLNQVSLTTYQSEDPVFAWNIDNFFSGCGGGWWGRDPAPCFWDRSYVGPRQRDNQQGDSILVKPNQAITLFTFRPDLFDLPIEISAATTLTSKGGGVGLFCRYTAKGRYEFVIQPDGEWYIRRNTSYWYEPRSARITVLAHGKQETFNPENNQISAVCSGSEQIFSLNGEELGRAQDDFYPEGQAGIFFDAFTEGSFTGLSIQKADPLLAK